MGFRSGRVWGCVGVGRYIIPFSRGDLSVGGGWWAYLLF